MSSQGSSVLLGSLHTGNENRERTLAIPLTSQRRILRMFKEKSVLVMLRRKIDSWEERGWSISIINVYIALYEMSRTTWGTSTVQDIYHMAPVQ